MQTIFKPSATIRQNYNEIANLCKETGEPVFLTRNGEGDLVVMDISVYDQRVKQLELREKLVFRTFLPIQHLPIFVPC